MKSPDTDLLNLSTRLDEIASIYPEKPCLIFQTRKNQWESIPYKKILEKTDFFVSKIQGLCLEPGLRAALMIPPSIDFFCFVFALLKVGITPIIVDPAIGLRNVTKCYEESKPELFIGDWLTHSLRNIFGWGRGSIRTNISLYQFEHLTPKKTLEPFDLSKQDGNWPAAIIYTSGSTGLPKGAIYTHANLRAQLEMLSSTFRISQDEIDLPAFPLFALIDCLIGVTAIIPDMRFPPPAKVNSKKIFLASNRFNVSNLFASPVELDKLSTFGAHQNITLPGIKRVITAGAPTPVKVLENFYKLLSPDANLFGIYGATESLPMTVINCKEILTDTRYQTAKGAGICIGKPVNNACIRIIEISDHQIEFWQDSLEVNVNICGEITVKGPAVTRSYFGRPELNYFSKIQDGNDIVHRTGDLGYIDQLGRVWYCGRKSHRVETTNGVFFTEQIEGIFNSHPLVNRTALVGVKQQPILWVELEKQAQNQNKAKIKEELSLLAINHQQAAMIKTYLFMKTFPTDVRHNSKILREKLTILALRRLT